MHAVGLCWWSYVLSKFQLSSINMHECVIEIVFLLWYFHTVAVRNFIEY